jgi:hypothetical protein
MSALGALNDVVARGEHGVTVTIAIQAPVPVWPAHAEHEVAARILRVEHLAKLEDVSGEV